MYIYVFGVGEIYSSQNRPNSNQTDLKLLLVMWIQCPVFK